MAKYIKPLLYENYVYIVDHEAPIQENYLVLYSTLVLSLTLRTLCPKKPKIRHMARPIGYSALSTVNSQDHGHVQKVCNGGLEHVDVSTL
jgi:hypothetical protein